MVIHKKQLLLLVVMPLSFAVFGQDSETNSESTDFTLFESLDNASSNSASSVPGRNNARERGARNTTSSPVFTLVGTSRIGNSESALLKHMEGDTVRVPLNGESNPVPDHEAYLVISHGDGNVGIRYPASAPCSDFPEQGVSCDSETNIATLSLTMADPVVVARAEPQTESGEDLEEVAEEPSRNPFEAIRDRGRAAGSAQATEATRFQPRRIDPADVPPGMRVVSTPFGDRLVQQ